jgi:hypothetical protein
MHNENQKDCAMRKNRDPEKPANDTTQVNGLKRRDLLLSGSSLLAASTLSSIGLTSPARNRGVLSSACRAKAPEKVASNHPAE